VSYGAKDKTKKNNMMKSIKSFYHLSVVSALFVGFASSASALDPLSAGAIRDTLKTDRKQLPPSQPKVERSKPVPQKSVKKGGKKIQVNKFEIIGNTLFSAEELTAVIADKEGKAHTLNEIYAVSNILTKFYRDHGYDLATAVVPAQKVNSGVIKLQISEGIVDKITFNGNTRYSDEFMLNQLDRIAPGTALRLDDMEREVLLLDEMPGLTARSLIEPGEKQGTASIVFNTEEDPVEGLILIDNAGSDTIGLWRITGSMTVNNPFKLGGALTFGHTHTEENLLRNYQVAYNFPISNDGTRVSFDFSRANFDIGADFADLNIDGDSMNGKLSISHPFVRSRKDNLLGAFAIVSQMSETRADGDKVGNFDPNLTYFEVSATGSRVHDDQSFTTGFLSFATNFKGKGSDDNVQRNNALAAVLNFDFSHERAILPEWSLFTRLSGVMSREAQMDLTQFGIGGTGSVRGFASSEARGDYGYFVQVEGRRSLAINEDLSAGFKVFLDHGEVYRKDVAAGDRQAENLSSYGVGMNLTYLQDYNLDIMVAKPFKHDGRSDGAAFSSDGKGSGRVWVTLSAGL
jgi:hemolysin activation/secretion protein